MSSGMSRGLLSMGAFIVICIVCLLLIVAGIITDWVLIIPLIILLSGVWLIALGGMRAASPQKYERGPFSTASWGLLLVALGGGWFLYGYNVIYSLIIVLVALAVIVIIAAVKRK